MNSQENKTRRHVESTLRKCPESRNKDAGQFLIIYAEIWYEGSHIACYNSEDVEYILRYKRYLQNTLKKYLPDPEVKQKREEKRIEYKKEYGAAA
jgi:hypothetical protein